MKKLLLFIALTIFGLGLNAQNVGDETTIDYDGYSLKFKITSVEPAECELSDYSGLPTDITIPSTVEIEGTEYIITSIEYRTFYYCSSLTNIEIPNTVTSIPQATFRGCSSLTSITFGDNPQLTSIGNYAFSDCSSLTSIEIPNSVTSIGYGAFSDCSSLTSIVVAEGNTVYDSRENCNAIIETSSNTLIAGCQNTVIPNSVTSIGYDAFRGCSSLTSIEIPNSVTSIGDDAFSGCSSLTSIEIPNSVTSIGDYTFYYCYSLTSIEIPNSVTSIGSGAFSYCSSLTSIEIPNSVTSIGYMAFYWCLRLTSIEIPNSVTSIGYEAFSECSSLTSITFGDNPQLTSIGNYAFSECSSLTSITFGDNPQLTSIGNYAFSGCSSLTSIEIPNSVTSIGSWAFSDCSSLTSIVIPNTVTSIGERVFSDCSSLTSIVVAEGNTVYDSRENCNAIIETSSNTLTAGCQNTVIPNSVTEIGYGAFSGCSSLTSIDIPSSVTSIGERVFSYCSSLTSIEIPNSVTSIGRSSFSYCSSLRVITCYAENIPETGDYVFDYCPSDMIIYVPEVSLEDYKSASPWNAFTILSLNEGPRNIIATTDSAFSVNLSWDNCYADSYNVYRNGDSIANVTNPTYTDIDLEYNTEYCYTVTAVRNETESDKSEEKCAKTFDLPITTPENLVAEALSTSSISLSWNEVENALSYNIYQSNELIANIEETTFTIDSLEYNTEYCYTVTAVRNETESDKSEEVCAKTLDLPITTPENLVAEALSTSSIILTWDNVENALSYNVYRDGDSIANVTNPTYTDVDLEYNTEYCYTVTAVRNETESDKSEEKCVKTFDLPITTPENLIANVLSTSSIILTWDNVENALSYNVYRDGDSIANVTNPTYTDVDLEYNTEYCYTVTAVRNETESDKSEEKCAKTLGESINELSSSINIYPNPVENDLFIATEMNVKEVAIYDVYGRLCCRDASNASTSNSMDTFNVSVQDLEAGVYFVNVKTENGNIVKRFVKK